MEKKEFLTEENYEKGKKKIKSIALIILIVGVVLGGALIATGIIKTKSSKTEAEKVNEERYNAAYKESEEKVAAAKERLSEIDTEKKTLSAQYDSKSQECDSLNMTDSDWYTKVNQCRREASTIKSKINELESEKFELENASYKVYYEPQIAKNYIFLSIIGGIIIIISCSVSLSIYLFAKRREIMAFTAQQVMPVAQEGIEKMSPTIGNAAGTIGKSLAQGITSGIKEGLNSQQPESTESTENKEI